MLQTPLLKEPSNTADAAGLHYVSDDSAGIIRLGKPGRFRYRLPNGKFAKDVKTLKRIRALAIPPAWTDVWIAPSPDGHLQATGRDARGRKQYRYHSEFIAIRDNSKYAHLADRQGVAGDSQTP